MLLCFLPVMTNVFDQALLKSHKDALQLQAQHSVKIA